MQINWDQLKKLGLIVGGGILLILLALPWPGRNILLTLIIVGIMAYFLVPAAFFIWQKQKLKKKNENIQRAKNITDKKGPTDGPVIDLVEKEPGGKWVEAHEHSKRK